MKVLKKDLESKEILANYLQFAISLEAEEENKKAEEFMDICDPVMGAYKKLQLGESGSNAIKLLDSAYIKVSAYHIMEREAPMVMDTNDSLSFYLFKNHYLSEVIRLLDHLNILVPRSCFPGKSYENVVFPSQLVYSPGDTFSARILPLHFEPDIAVTRCDVFRDGKKIRSLDKEKDGTYSFGPLDKGGYSLKIRSSSVGIQNPELLYSKELNSFYEFAIK